MHTRCISKMCTLMASLSQNKSNFVLEIENLREPRDHEPTNNWVPLLQGELWTLSAGPFCRSGENRTGSTFCKESSFGASKNVDFWE